MSAEKGRQKVSRLEEQNELLKAALQLAVNQLRSVGADIEQILSANPGPFEAARRAKAARADGRVARAKILATTLSASQVGIRMAREEGRAEPFSERTVRRWLAQKG